MNHPPTKTPSLAPPNFDQLEPCEDRSNVSVPIPWPEYVGSGVPLREHPFREDRLVRGGSVRCAACGNEDTLCIYLYFTGGLGSGDDVAYELRCRDCGAFTVYEYTS